MWLMVSRNSVHGQRLQGRNKVWWSKASQLIGVRKDSGDTMPEEKGQAPDTAPHITLHDSLRYIPKCVLLNP